LAKAMIALNVVFNFDTSADFFIFLVLLLKKIVHTMEKEKNGLGRLTHSSFKVGTSV
jgi:hypothetical protein